MDCPVCLEPMQCQELFGTPVDLCRFCGGVWFDGGELSGFIEKRNIPGRVLSNYCLDDSRMSVKEGERKCPVCGDRFAVIGYKGVNVDFCKKCRGMWFDKGELANLLKNYYRESKGIKPVVANSVQSADAVDDDDIIQVDLTALGLQASSAKRKEPAGRESLNDVEEELLAGLTRDDLLKAIPKNILDKPGSGFSGEVVSLIEVNHEVYGSSLSKRSGRGGGLFDIVVDFFG